MAHHVISVSALCMSVSRPRGGQAHPACCASCSAPVEVHRRSACMLPRCKTEAPPCARASCRRSHADKRNRYRLLPAAAFDFCCLPLFWMSALCFSFRERMRMLVGSVLTIWSSAFQQTLVGVIGQSDRSYETSPARRSTGGVPTRLSPMQARYLGAMCCAGRRSDAQPSSRLHPVLGSSGCLCVFAPLLDGGYKQRLTRRHFSSTGMAVSSREVLGRRGCAHFFGRSSNSPAMLSF